MPVHNKEISDILSDLADFLEIEDANPFRIRAYRNAARTISGLSHSVSELLNKGKDLTELPGIGKDLSAKIEEIHRSGKLSLLEETKRRLPPGLLQILKIQSLGPKRVKQLYKELHIKNLTDLKKAAKGPKIRNLPGFGDKTVNRILEELARHPSGEAARMRFDYVEDIAQPLVAYLKKIPGVQKVEVAGSYRRRLETVGDLDILVNCASNAKVMDRFVEYEDVKKVLAHGPTKSSVVLRSNFQVDLRAMPKESYGAAMVYFTGSKAHNVAIRKIALQKNLKINEYGVFKKNKQVAGESEKSVYQSIGLPYIEPELREDRGEIESALKKKFLRLVTQGQIKGDLHSHTTASDGRATLEQMAQAAKEKGYEYLAITDHTQHVTIANGLNEKQMLAHIKKIDRLNTKLKGIRLLKSAEVDILSDGSLDLPDSVLKEMDLTVCSIHYQFNLPEDKQTERIIRAMDNPYFNIMGHPTGRLILKRPAYPINMERLMQAAKDRGCFFEINAQPSRMDLNDLHCKMAKEFGIKISISTDAHATHHLDYIRFGIGMARRGGLEAKDILNTRKWQELKKLLKRK